MQFLNNDNEIIPTDPVEIIETINGLNSNKAIGPYSISDKIIDLVKINISEPLSNIVYLLFVNALYFDNLKISKATPVYKDKGTLLDCCNYRQLFFSNIIKCFEPLMYK